MALLPCDTDVRRQGHREKLFNNERARRFQAIEATALAKLLDAALSVNELRAVPGNRLEKLPEFGDDFYSLRINAQYRIAFRWEAGNADDVRISDHYKS